MEHVEDKIPRLLVVDDDVAFRQIIAGLLRKENYQVDEASDGKEACGLLQGKTYNVVIVDLRMPRMDGHELLRWIRENQPGVVVIVLSGTTSVEDALKAVSEGAFSFITKPLEEREFLYLEVRRAIEHGYLLKQQEQLLARLQQQAVELENRLAQLETAYSILQKHAAAVAYDLKQAMYIQQGLLPHQNPREDVFSVAALYWPPNKVGGDLFDLFPLQDRKLGAYIADISGHGISSAMVSIFLKHCLHPPRRGDKTHPLYQPDTALVKANRSFVSACFGQNMFASMFYVVVDPVSREIQYGSAGHPPAFLLHEDGSIDRLQGREPALGVFPSFSYTTQRVFARENDLLILYTDGVPESTNYRGELFGKERLAVPAGEDGANPSAYIHEMYDRLREFAGGDTLSDDATIVAIGFKPQTEPYLLLCPSYKTKEESGENDEVITPLVETSRTNNRQYIKVSGFGSWREAERTRFLLEQALKNNTPSIVLDLGDCRHLDSTFMGMLHDFSKRCSEKKGVVFEVQHIPPKVLHEMTELGLSSLLSCFRPEPHTLPDGMQHVSVPENMTDEARRIVLHAHQALVDADPKNADRFAAVLKILEAQTHHTCSSSQDNAAAGTDESSKSVSQENEGDRI